MSDVMVYEDGTIRKFKIVQTEWAKNNMFHFGTCHFMWGYVNQKSIKLVMNNA